MDNVLHIAPVCAECGADFEDGEEIYSWDEGFVCCDCFDSLFDDLSRSERAELLGCEVIKYRRPSGTPV